MSLLVVIGGYSCRYDSLFVAIGGYSCRDYSLLVAIVGYSVAMIPCWWLSVFSGLKFPKVQIAQLPVRGRGRGKGRGRKVLGYYFKISKIRDKISIGPHHLDFAFETLQDLSSNQTRVCVWQMFVEEYDTKD